MAVDVVQPPVELVLAKSSERVPGPDPRWAFEPKFDGWRGVLFRSAGVLQSRRGSDLAVRFPEVMAAAESLGDVVLDGEVVALREGRLDFGALASSPRSRAAAGVTIYYVAFDLLAANTRDLRGDVYRVRRERLEGLFANAAPPLQLVPSTPDRDTALAWMRGEVAEIGIEGVVAKLVDRAYRPGRTGDWVKTRQKTVVDAVVVGVTGAVDRPEEVVLARRDNTGELRRIGLSLPLPPRLRDEVGQHVTSTGEPLALVSSGAFGRGRTEYQPVRPTLVVEVEAEASVEFFTSRLRPRVYRLRLDLSSS